MSNRYKGGVISATPPTTTGGESGTASGAWTLEQQMQLQAAGLWPAQPTGPYIEELFSTYLYTGNDTTQTITNGIDLSTKGGMVWIKPRNQAQNHVIFDTVGGITKSLATNNTNVQYTATAGNEGLASFNTTGFTAKLFQDSTGINNSACNLVSWTFREQPKFFDIVTWTGDGTSNRAISHSLASTPGCIFVKRLDGGGDDWAVYHTSLGTSQRLYLNTTDAASGATAVTAVSSTTFTVNQANNFNFSGLTYVAYLFAHNAGGFGLTGTDNVISCGSYTGNGSAGGLGVTLGYEPQWLLVKNASYPSGGLTAQWLLVDNMRGMTADGSDNWLAAQSTSSESTNTAIAPTATGFTAFGASGFNRSGDTFIYIAIRRGPMRTPTSSTTVFYPTTYTGTGVARTFSGFGFPPDFELSYSRGGSAAGDNNGPEIYDKLRGTTVRLLTPSTAAEFTGTEPVTMIQDGISVGATTNSYINASGYTKVLYGFKRAPSFFDEVCYTGDTSGGSQIVAHNLTVTPELIIIKSRSNTSSWEVGQTNWAFQGLNNINSGAATALNATSSTFDTGIYSNNNTSGYTYVAYLFATAAGVSKVGSYAGTGATQTINCGFTGGARWVLIKRANSTGGWYVWDTARGMVSGTDPSFFLNSTNAEVNANSVYTITTGFQIVSTDAGINASGGTYIFLAIA